MTDYLELDRDFNMLSLVHLLEARDLYHVHLMNKPNVVATAIGRYRIRHTDPQPPARPAPETKKEKRTLENSELRTYSWPCILVFLDHWVEQENIGYGKGQMRPEETIPKALHLPDGKVVPVCVIEAPRDESRGEAIDIGSLNFPKNIIGGGYPVITEVQQQQHIASIGCLLTDGHFTYALTNRHVAGEPGEPIFALMGGRKIQIGISSKKQISRLPFQKVYEEWPGGNIYVNLDVGLIEVENENIWTAQVYGTGPLGRLADLSINNISLRLIGCPVRAYGCASGQMFGEIHGLFYRYKTVGGFEYVADLLIGPRKETAFGTHPGDSGTVWVLETNDAEKGLMPIAVQWGGHVFLEKNETGQFSFALATCLSTICNQLEVDVIRDWNIGFPEYWGAVGHYAIGSLACDAVTNANLKQFMQANRKRISFDTQDISSGNLKGLSKERFVPLADVPDLVWKLGNFKRGRENSAHFADMDKPNSQGKTLMDLCNETSNITVEVWQQYYDDVHDRSRGHLPFRVWQIYNEMVKSVTAGDRVRFLCAAGVLAHYVGDACQALHISYMFDGDPNDTIAVTTTTSGGAPKTKMVPRATGVHSAYENDMLNFHTIELIAGVRTALGLQPLPDNVADGREAAVAVVGLMRNTFQSIQPAEIVNEFNANAGSKPKALADSLWAKFGPGTIQNVTAGCQTLAMLWESAWKTGDGDHTLQDLSDVAEDDIIALYRDKDFLPSVRLDDIGPFLK